MKSVLVAAVLLFCSPLYAGEMHLSTGHNDYEQDREPVQSGGANADVMVDMPPEVWTQGQNNQPPCLRCCTYQNRSYTEGSVVKMEGVLLQCSRDEKSYGTNNLIWQTVK